MIGRLIAILVIIASSGVIAWHHRADLLPAAAPPPNPVEAAYRACLAERLPGIEKMLTDGVIREDQATLFKSRADALCASQAQGATPQ